MATSLYGKHYTLLLITGLPNSGKTTLSNELKERGFQNVVHMDEMYSGDIEGPLYSYISKTFPEGSLVIAEGDCFLRTDMRRYLFESTKICVDAFYCILMLTDPELILAREDRGRDARRFLKIYDPLPTQEEGFKEIVTVHNNDYEGSNIECLIQELSCLV